MSDLPTIAIAADHGGFRLKQAVVAQLRAAGHAVTDFGTDDATSVDYPDFAHPVCAAVLAGAARFGVLICGTGLGMAIAANRHSGIRCAMLNEATSARLTRAHNDANVVAMGGRMIGEETAFDILRVFLSTSYDGGRHDARLAKLDAPLKEPA